MKRCRLDSVDSPSAEPGISPIDADGDLDNLVRRPPSASHHITLQSGTTFRDSAGRRIDSESELVRRAGALERCAEAEARERRDRAAGEAQRAQASARAAELADAATATLARPRSDATLDNSLRLQLRDGDPLSGLVQRQLSSSEKNVGPDSKRSSPRPTYSGPPPAPNRFGIRPGFRWDGVDRGGGWEAKVFAARNAARAKDERGRAGAARGM